MEVLAHLFEQWSGHAPESVLSLAPSGSNRQYYRLRSATHSTIGTYGAEQKENQAFLYYSRHFQTKGIPVPRIYAEAEDQQFYLQEDLGNTSLYDLLPPPGAAWTAELVELYKKAVTQLARM